MSPDICLTLFNNHHFDQRLFLQVRRLLGNAIPNRYTKSRCRFVLYLIDDLIKIINQANLSAFLHSIFESTKRKVLSLFSRTVLELCSFTVSFDMYHVFITAHCIDRYCLVC